MLCHADLHHNNVLIGTDDQFWIVDWDDTQLAPKECDLMMGVGGLRAEIVGPREEAWFLKGYGRTDVDPVALAYDRHVRAVGDLGYNVEQVVFMPGLGDAARRTALERTRLLFAPGYIVELAGQLDGVAR